MSSEIRIIKYTKLPVATSDSDDTYYDLIADIRTGVNEVIDTLRALESYFEDKENLKKAIESDFDRMEKITYELKNITKKLNKKKVIRR